jgi:multicomponent Na+:H+ antiporter subunit E
MSLLTANLLLAVLWMALTDGFGGANLVVGLLLGYGVLFVSRRDGSPRGYLERAPQTLGFLLFFVRELVTSSLRVAYEALTPTVYTRPAVLAVPLEARTDAEITLLACVVTLTPGTLTIDVSPDRRHLFVHAMFAGDSEAVRRQIKSGFERRLLRLLR